MKSILFLFVLGLTGSSFLLAEPVQKLPRVVTYEELRSAVRQTREQTKRRVAEFAEQERVREAWRIGKLIDEHVLHYKERADYATYVIPKLAKDVGMDKSELYRMLEFAHAYPIVVPAQQLTWSHYQALIPIKDTKERDSIAERAEKEDWTRDRLRDEIKGLNSKKAASEFTTERLTAAPGKLDTYRVVLATHGPYQGKPTVDLGFSNYYRPEGKFSFKVGDMVSRNKKKLKKIQGAGEQDRWTYRAYAVEVIDGDTFSAVIDLGFGFTTFQTLRLRALDAPEVQSTTGIEAKKFLEKMLPSHIVIKTHKSDKYDRYLADVWVGEIYVNQALVAEGLASVVED